MRNWFCNVVRLSFWLKEMKHCLLCRRSTGGHELALATVGGRRPLRRCGRRCNGSSRVHLPVWWSSASSLSQYVQRSISGAAITFIIYIYPVYTIQPLVKPVVQPGLTAGLTNSGCSFNRLYNRFNNWLYTRYSRLSNRLSNMIQPVVKTD